MAARTNRGTGGAAALSLGLHALALTAMVLGLKATAPLQEGRAVEARLIRRPEPQPPPEPAVHTPGRANPAFSTRLPRALPQPPPEATPVAPPPSAAPAPGPQSTPEAVPKDLAPALRGLLGCEESLRLSLSTEQRQACADRAARQAQTTRPLGPHIPDGKKAEYDRYANCRAKFRERGMPSMNPAANPSSPTNPSPSSINPSYGLNPGVAPAPDWLGCPP